MSSDSESDSNNHDLQVISTRLGRCDVCDAKPAKYTCPKCGLKSCNLSCVRIHKRELKCDGIRDKTKFVRRENFTDRDLFSDYRMLEETARLIYGKKRDEAKKYTRIDKDLPFIMHLMRKAASRRGTVLMFTLHHFTRRKQNTNYYDRKNDKINWRVEWIFPNADPQSVKLVDPQCPEDTKLADLLDKYLDPDMEKIDNSNSLMYYQSAGHIGVKVLLKAERIKACSNKFHELDMDVSLKENLSGKCIVEFPIIFVVLKDHCYGLEIIDSDDETDTRIGSNTNETSAPLVRYASNPLPRQLLTEKVAMEKKKTIEREIAQDRKKKPKNLLFTTGYSSDELSNCSSNEDESSTSAKKSKVNSHQKSTISK